MTEETRFVLVELEKVERKLDHLIDEVRGQKITIELINKSLSRSKNGRVTIGVLVCAARPIVVVPQHPSRSPGLWHAPAPI